MPKNKKDESSSDSEVEQKSSKKVKRDNKKKKNDSDSDSGPEDRNPKKKAPSGGKKQSSDEDNKWSIGKNRFAALREFKGTWYVDIREYYNADGDMRPGKKGIMLQMEQWQRLKNAIPDIEEAIKQNV